MKLITYILGDFVATKLSLIGENLLMCSLQANTASHSMSHFQFFKYYDEFHQRRGPAIISNCFCK